MKIKLANGIGNIGKRYWKLKMEFENGIENI